MKTLSLLLALFISHLIQAQIITNFTTTDGLANNNVLCLTADHSGNMWFGTQSGVSKFNGTTWSTFNTTTDNAIPNNTIKAIDAMRNEDIWIGTDFGIAVYNRDSWTAFTTADGLGSNRINSITQVSNGDVWIADFNGATRFSGDTFTKFGTADGLPFGGVTEIKEGKNGEILMATSLAGLIAYKNTLFTTYNESNGLLSNSTASVEVSPDSTIWVGTSKGVSVFDKTLNLMESYTKMYILPPPDTLNPVKDIAIDRRGNVWVGIYVDYLVTVGGVAFYDGNAWKNYDESDGIVGPVIRKVALDGNDNLWVATSSGISKIESPHVSISNVQNHYFSVYPNPADDVLHLKLKRSNNPSNILVQLFNIQKEVQLSTSMPFGMNQLTISTKHLNSGIYILKIGTQTRKIIVH
ncbi:T9SS type A sorting domain-containing protein [Bacteroidia bacterium]|nr:T9SS type A sorting domain-containing protein [Bacteroidia bacterium]